MPVQQGFAPLVENPELADFQVLQLYLHFINEVRCAYSATVNLDITALKGYRLYPAMIWLLTKTVNQMPEFRTALTDEGLGIYDQILPAYTIFNQESKTFSGIWTEANPDYSDFLKAYEADAAEFSSSAKFAPKPDRPLNSFDISMVPCLHSLPLIAMSLARGNTFFPYSPLGNFSKQTAEECCRLRFKLTMFGL